MGEGRKGVAAFQLMHCKEMHTGFRLEKYAQRGINDIMGTGSSVDGTFCAAALIQKKKE